MEAVATRADPLRFGTLNRQFHAAILARCPNRHLVELIDQMHLQLDRVRSTMLVYLPQRSEEAAREHNRLIARLRSADGEDVER
jgi:DNA-binding GntR family transcriptional regulator